MAWRETSRTGHRGCRRQKDVNEREQERGKELKVKEDEGDTEGRDS